PTEATCGLSEANVTPVAGPITAPVSSAKLARNPYRRFSGRPSRVADSLSPAAMTRICQVTTSPGPGPLAVSVVFPALFPVSNPDTEDVVLPGATAVTTPVSETRATFATAEDHCIVRGLTTRPPCPGTITCSVSTAFGPSATGLGSWIAMSLGCTTTGAVAV